MGHVGVLDGGDDTKTDTKSLLPPLFFLPF